MQVEESLRRSLWRVREENATPSGCCGACFGGAFLHRTTRNAKWGGVAGFSGSTNEAKAKAKATPKGDGWGGYTAVRRRLGGRCGTRKVRLGR